MLAAALFDRIEVLGTQEMAVDLSAHALRYGMGDILPRSCDYALVVGARGFEPPTHSREIPIVAAASRMPQPCQYGRYRIDLVLSGQYSPNGPWLTSLMPSGRERSDASRPQPNSGT